MNKLKVLVLDDSLVFRSLLKRVLRTIPQVGEIVSSGNGNYALEMIEDTNPDFVLVDLIMPGMSGVEFIRELKSIRPQLPFVVLSNLEIDNEESYQALEMGALEFIEKPGMDTDNPEDYLAGRLKTSIEKCLKMPASSVPEAGIKKESDLPARPKKPEMETPDLVLIGASTGGPKVLKELFSNISGPPVFPIAIVQHIPKDFSSYLASSLNRSSALHRVVEVTTGLPMVAGEAYVAAGESHLVIEEREKGELWLQPDLGAPVNGCKPSVDAFCDSLLNVSGLKVLVIILTGMGSDGANGVERLVRKGAQCWIQDEESSVVWGMPGEVAKRGCYHEILTIPEIASRLNSWV